MAILGDALINWAALGKILLAALVCGVGVVVAFGILLLAVKSGRGTSSTSRRVGSVVVSGLAGLFCIGVVVIGIYAMAKKPSSKPAPPATSSSKAPSGTP